MVTACCIPGGPCSSATAATISWSGSTSTAWATGSNWIGNAAPANDTTTDRAAFDFALLPAYEPNAGTRSIAGIVIGDGSTAVPSFTIAGTLLSIGGDGVTKLAGAGDVVISSPAALAAAQAWTNDSASLLTVSGNVAADGRTFTAAGTGTTIVTGIISGTAGLRKEGSGRLILEAANTFTGGVTIAGGVLEAGKAGSKQTLGPDSNTLTFDGAGATLFVADTVTNSTRTYLFLQEGTIDTAGNDLTLKGAVTGSAGMIKSGLGTLRLEGTNTFSGTATVLSGTLELAGGAALADTAPVVVADAASARVQAAATQTIGSLAGGGAAGGTVSIDNGVTLTVGAAGTSTSFAGRLDGRGTFVKSGSGTLVLTNTATNDAYTGRIDLTGGTISIAAVESLGQRGTTREFHFYDGATLQTTADMSFNTRVFQLYTADAGGIAGRFDVAAGTTTTLKGDVQGLAGSGGLLKKGAGTLVLDTGATASKTYRGSTTVSEGTLRINAQLSNSPSLTVAAGAVLSGTGRIDQAVTTISGTHSPGNSPGIQQFGASGGTAGSLTYEAGSSVIWELVTSSTASRGINYDGIDVFNAGGTLGFAGATAMHLSFSGSAAGITPVSWSDAFWDENHSWVVYAVEGTTSSIDNLSVYRENWLDGTGGQFDTLRPSGVFWVRQSGNNVELVYAVPEPSAWVILAGGLAGLAVRCRRRGGGRGPRDAT